MEHSVQLFTFFITIVTGIVLGLVFDCYRVFWRTVKPKLVLTWILDLLYWLIATVIVLVALLFSNWGELRFYIFIGIVSGAIVYYRLLSTYIIKIIIYTVHMVSILINFINNILNILIFRPAIYLTRLFKRPFTFITSKFLKWYHIKFPQPPKDT